MNPRALAPAALLAALLGACGGGGGGGGGGLVDAPLAPPGPPLVRVSAGTPFAPGCTSLGGATNYVDSEVEPHVAVDPTDANHLLGAWQQDRFSNGGSRGLVTAVSSDGGLTWTQQALAASGCGGGGFERATDPWVAFAADGRAYAIALAFDQVSSGDNEVQVFRSLDGGTTWGAPTTLISDGAANFNDKEAIAADRSDPLYAYAAWDRLTADNRGPAMFARTIDGGATWSAAVEIYDPGVGAQTIGCTPLVAPDGTVYTLLNRSGGSADNVDQTFTVNLSLEAADGTWRLRVQDAASLDTGFINSWTLNLRP